MPREGKIWGECIAMAKDQYERHNETKNYGIKWFLLSALDMFIK